jgi:hypothetical protein
MLKATVDHLIATVLPAARDYNEAEQGLSAAFAAACLSWALAMASTVLVWGSSGGIQVIVQQTDGQQRIFLADVPCAIAGWFAFLKHQGASVPAERFTVCSLPVN